MRASDHEPPWRRPVRGSYPDPSLLAQPGIEQIRAFTDGRAPVPPVGELLGMTVAGVGEGTTTFEMPASEWLLSPRGFVSVGTLAILADGPLGCAIQTALPPATGYATSELSLRLLRPLRAGGRLVARGTLVHAGRRLAVSGVRIADERGRLVCDGSCMCFVRSLRGVDLDAPAPSPPVGGASVPGPPPPPVLGAVVEQEVWDRRSGLEVLEAHVAGELPPPPLHHLVGVRPTDAEHGRAVFALPCHEWLCSPLRTIEGGAIAMLADCALSGAMQTLAPAGTALGVIDLKVNFLRPVAPDGRDLVAQGRVRHAGRTFAVADAEVLNADGKPVALATGSAMMLAGRPALGERD